MATHDPNLGPTKQNPTASKAKERELGGHV